jgi:ankyrin repeat protein
MRKGDAEMVALLASHGASRALHLLAYYGDVVTAAAMLGADSRLADDPDALVNAAEEGQEAFVRLLLRVRPGLARKVGVGGKTRVITELLFADGMDANFRDWLGATPLHHFARRGDVENTRLFLERGARVDVVDEDLRLTPLGWAERFGKGEVAEVLRGNCV